MPGTVTPTWPRSPTTSWRRGAVPRPRRPSAMRLGLVSGRSHSSPTRRPPTTSGGHSIFSGVSSSLTTSSAWSSSSPSARPSGRAARPLADRLGECAEVVRRAELLGDLSLEYQGHFLAQIIQLEAGDLAAADAEMASASAIADELRIPAYQPWLTAYRAMRATLDGRFDEGDSLAQEAFDQAGAHMIDPEAATTVIGGQQIAQRIFRGGVEEFVPVLEAMVADNPQHPMIATFLP